MSFIHLGSIYPRNIRRLFLSEVWKGSTSQLQSSYFSSLRTFRNNSSRKFLKLSMVIKCLLWELFIYLCILCYEMFRLMYILKHYSYLPTNINRVIYFIIKYSCIVHGNYFSFTNNCIWRIDCNELYVHQPQRYQTHLCG